MTTQASPASIKSRFACKARPHDRFSEWKTESLARPQATAAMRRHSIRAAERHTKKAQLCRVFLYPDPALLERDIRVSKCGFSGTTFRI